MSSYKHVSKQRKLAEQNKELQLSDEDSSGNSASEDEGSDSDSEFGSEASGSGEESDGEEGGSGGEDEVEEEEEELLPPPPGFPTALEAVEKPVGEDPGGNGENVVCVICPDKVLKKGRMLEVHLGGKAHQRRANRFKSHIESPDFDSASLHLDARDISAQLDKVVLGRLIEQTIHGGPSIPSASTSTSTPKSPKAPKPKPVKDNSINDAKNAEAAERKSKRAELKAARELRNKESRIKKKEKLVRLKEAKAKAGEVDGGKLSKEEVKEIMKGDRAVAAEIPKLEKGKKVFVKPTAAEIASRQALKEAKRAAAQPITPGTPASSKKVADPTKTESPSTTPSQPKTKKASPVKNVGEVSKKRKNRHDKDRVEGGARK